MDLSKNGTFCYRRFLQKSYQKRSFLILWKERMMLRGKKWGFKKSQKMDTLSNNRIFSYRCFSKKLCQKRSFLDTLNRKQSFWDHKIEDLTRAKKWSFLMRLVHGFSPKIEFFLIGVFHRNQLRKDRFWYCGKKVMILRRILEVLKKAQKMDIFESPCILSKNRNFSYGWFLQKLCEKKSFFVILDRKQSLLDPEIEVLIRAQKWTSFKGFSPWTLSKNRTFSYRRFSQKRLCFDILERKQPFLDQTVQF